MDKKPEIKRAQETYQNANEELEITEEISKKWKEEEEQLRKEGFSGLDLGIRLIGPIIDTEKLGITVTDELLKQWDKEEEEWRKEGLSESEIVKRRLGPLMSNDILWE